MNLRLAAGFWMSIMGSFLLPCAYADPAPVVDLGETATNSDAGVSTSAPQRPDLSNLSLDQRIALLEKQVSNNNQMNFPGKLDNLQQQLDQLRGQLETQGHDLKTLNEQLKTYYQDLNKRLDDLKAQYIAPPASKDTLTSTSDTNKEPTSSATKNSADKKPHSKIASTDVPTDPVIEEKSYQVGFSALAKKQTTVAVTGFKNYLGDYPRGKYAANAHYWLGELYSTQNKPNDAKREFTQVITDFSTNSRVPDAMLKLAIIRESQGNHAQAQKDLQKIVKAYPTSTAAKLAKLKLKSLATPDVASTT